MKNRNVETDIQCPKCISRYKSKERKKTAPYSVRIRSCSDEYDILKCPLSKCTFKPEYIRRNNDNRGGLSE